MTAPASQIPSWFKWAVGLGAAAAVVAGGVIVAREVQKPMPWKTPSLPPKRRTDFQGLELYVLQGDEDEDTWSVMVTKYLEVDGEHMYSGSIDEILEVDTKKKAIALARELGKKARASKKYKLVYVVATDADHKRANARRQRQKEG
jgi:hypothetical protein